MQQAIPNSPVISAPAMFTVRAALAWQADHQLAAASAHAASAIASSLSAFDVDAFDRLIRPWPTREAHDRFIAAFEAISV